jgi:hypothetical protein
MFIVYNLTIVVSISFMYHIVGHKDIDLLPRGMKSFHKQFSRFPYYEKLEITHLFDTMHIGKKIT